MQNSQSLAPIDYIFHKDYHYSAWLRDKHLRDTGAFLRGENSNREVTSNVDATRYQTIATLASHDAMSRFQAGLHDSAQLASKRHTAQILSGQKRIHEAVVNGNKHSAAANSLLEEANRSLEFQNTKLESIDSSLHELNATFSWFASSVVIELGSIGESLDKLIQLASNPSKTWALEQFDDARRFYRNNLIPEAFNCLQYAINGHGSNAGNSYDHKFLFLQGLIHLGTIGRSEESLVDTEKAKRSFLGSARLSLADYPTESSRALCYAARSAYSQGDFSDGLQLCNEALALNKPYSQANILAAQCAAKLGHIDTSKKHICDCLEADPIQLYAILQNEDLRLSADIVEQVLLELLPTVREKARIILSNLEIQTNDFCSITTGHIQHEELDQCKLMRSDLAHLDMQSLDYYQLRKYIPNLEFLIERNANYINNFEATIPSRISNQGDKFIQFLKVVSENYTNCYIWPSENNDFVIFYRFNRKCHNNGNIDKFFGNIWAFLYFGKCDPVEWQAFAEFLESLQKANLVPLYHSSVAKKNPKADEINKQNAGRMTQFIQFCSRNKYKLNTPELISGSESDYLVVLPKIYFWYSRYIKELDRQAIPLFSKARNIKYSYLHPLIGLAASTLGLILSALLYVILIILIFVINLFIEPNIVGLPFWIQCIFYAITFGPLCIGICSGIENALKATDE